MNTATRKQREALKAIWQKHIVGNENAPIELLSYLTWRRKCVHFDTLNGCIMAHALTMWLGVETDGYTHS